MVIDWRGYQEEAAAFFRKLGLHAEVDHEGTGARGTHMIDVWVTHSRFGMEMKWVVECKFWSSLVPKEKVMALMQIPQDVGADRAFLLSEKGFQSGAVRAAKNTNVVLSSLETLYESALLGMAEAEITSKCLTCSMIA